MQPKAALAAYLNTTTLTLRQRQVLTLLLLEPCPTDLQIAERLGIAESTVGMHVKAIKARFETVLPDPAALKSGRWLGSLAFHIGMQIGQELHRAA